MTGRLATVPILYKILLANVAIVVLGAIAGTYVTATTVTDGGMGSRTVLVLVFAVIGVLASTVVNFLVLSAAFRPLQSLERLSDAVRRGDLSARANPHQHSDPQLSRLAETFNGTLDELERDRGQLRELASQVIRAQEDERKRIARELHDDTAQMLFAQLLSVTSLKSSPNPDLRETAEKLENMTVEAIESVRRLALELRPPALDDLGLREALADLVQRFSEQLGLPVQFHWQGPRDRLAPELELVLYRVAQEALTNSAKHSGATQVLMSIRRDADTVILKTDDNGRGFDVNTAVRRDDSGLGLGLFGMEERLALVGGTLNILRLQPHGVRILATIPVTSDLLPSSVPRISGGPTP